MIKKKMLVIGVIILVLVCLVMYSGCKFYKTIEIQEINRQEQVVIKQEEELQREKQTQEKKKMEFQDYLVNLDSGKEEDYIKIDEYNFSQLEIVKATLSNETNSGYVLRNYNDFNEKFNQDIKSIKNCYFLKSKNGRYPYIFGFKLESKKYINKYGTLYYAYPEYDIPYHKLCFGEGKSNAPCQDRNYLEFKTTISNPCKN